MNPLATVANAVLIHGGALLGAAFRADYLHKCRHGKKASERCLKRIVRGSKNTEFGRAHDFAGIRTIEDYQRSVPLTTYEDYEPYIERTLWNGEQGLLTNHRIIYFAETSGTSGKSKLIPQTLAMVLPYFKGACIIANGVVRAMHHRNVPTIPAREFLVLLLDSKPTSEEQGRSKVRRGMVSSYAASVLRWVFPVIATTPGIAMGSSEITDTKYVRARYALEDGNLKFIIATYMSMLADIMGYIRENHAMLVHDIETGTIDPSIAMTDRMRKRLERRLRPQPQRAAELRAVFDAAEDSSSRLISDIWKNVSYISAVSTGEFEPFARKVRAMCADDVYFSNSAYMASEGLMGVSYNPSNRSYLFVLDTGFYEFLPVPDECDQMPDRPLLMHELEVGKHYEVIVTNLSGLYRYRIHDVVLITGFEGSTPYFDFAYRDTFVTDICSTHITAEQLALAMDATKEATSSPVVEYSLYGDAEHNKPRLELFVEMERAVSEEETARMAQVFDERMHEVSFDYAYYSDAGVMDAVKVSQVMPGTYRAYRESLVAAGQSENQIKVVRTINTPQKLEFFRSAAQEQEDSHV